MSEKPVYLVKFVPKYEYALTLRNGFLFMRPALKYDGMEGLQGDVEGIIGVIPTPEDGEIVLVKGHGYPIYCMYSVYNRDIIDGVIHINKQAIADFKCTDGFGVIISYDAFISKIPLTLAGSNVCFGNVKYRESIPDVIRLESLSSDAPDFFLN